jgi:hypothetical protein
LMSRSSTSSRSCSGSDSMAQTISMRKTCSGMRGHQRCKRRGFECVAQQHGVCAHSAPSQANAPVPHHANHQAESDLKPAALSHRWVLGKEHFLMLLTSTTVCSPGKKGQEEVRFAFGAKGGAAGQASNPMGGGHRNRPFAGRPVERPVRAVTPPPSPIPIVGLTASGYEYALLANK